MGRDALLHLLGTRKTDANLALYAHRIEAVTPYKHIYIYSVGTAGPSYLAAKSRINAAFPDLTEGFREIEPQPDSLEPQICVVDDLQKRIYLKLVHEVEMSGWVTVSPTEKRLKKFRKRHPVVVTLRLSEGIITIAFPGFT
jgi:hypothetical protein